MSDTTLEVGDIQRCRECGYEILFRDPWWEHMEYIGATSGHNPVPNAPQLVDDIPAGFWKIDAYTNGHQIVVLGSPPDSEDLGVAEDDAINHSCDEMGCGSVGPHVLAYIPLESPPPSLEWSNPNWKPEKAKENNNVV